jgi:hypothetical protein
VNSTPCLDGTLTNGASQITPFVISLGRAMLDNKCRDWMDMDFAAALCRKKGIQLNGTCPGSQDLESTLRAFFEENAEFYALGVNVDGHERRMGWDSVFCIRAYPNGPVQPLVPVNDHGPEASDVTPELKDERPLAPVEIQMN